MQLAILPQKGIPMTTKRKSPKPVKAWCSFWENGTLAPLSTTGVPLSVCGGMSVDQIPVMIVPLSRYRELLRAEKVSIQGTSIRNFPPPVPTRKVRGK